MRLKLIHGDQVKEDDMKVTPELEELASVIEEAGGSIEIVFDIVCELKIIMSDGSATSLFAPASMILIAMTVLLSQAVSELQLPHEMKEHELLNIMSDN